jgi:hypothetical protein
MPSARPAASAFFFLRVRGVPRRAGRVAFRSLFSHQKTKTLQTFSNNPQHKPSMGDSGALACACLSDREGWGGGGEQGGVAGGRVASLAAGRPGGPSPSRVLCGPGRPRRETPSPPTDLRPHPPPSMAVKPAASNKPGRWGVRATDRAVARPNLRCRRRTRTAAGCQGHRAARPAGTSGALSCRSVLARRACRAAQPGVHARVAPRT